MNWVAFWHLCWVLLWLNGVFASDHETSQTSLHPTSLKLPKHRRPLRSNNSIKKGPEANFKFPDVPQSTTESALSRLSSRKTTNVDYLARNTVPVAPVTESVRKSYRPPPSHLLAYQAVSTTEKGSERSSEPNLSPTGWALASLVPPKNATPPFPKRNVVVSGTAKPFNTYWSSRLRKPLQRTTPIAPTSVTSSVGSEKSQTESAIPVENLIKDDNRTSSHDIPPKADPTDEPTIRGLTSHPTERINYLEKPTSSELNEHTDVIATSHIPVRKHHESTTSPQQSTWKHHIENGEESQNRTLSSPRTSHFATSNPTEVEPNTGNNLLKEVKGGDLGSSILNGIVRATAATRYAQEAKHESTVTAIVTGATEDSKNNTLLGTVDSSEDAANTTQKLADESNTAHVATPQPDQLETASSSVVTRAPLGEQFSMTLEETASTQNSAEFQTVVTESPSGTLQEIMSSLGLSTVTNKMANLLENVISPTTSVVSTVEDSTTPVVTESTESSTNSYSLSPIAESVSETARAVTQQADDIQMANTFVSDRNSSSKTESITTTLSNGLVELGPTPVRQSTSNSDKSLEISATTLSQEVNDIPEAFTRVKDPTDLSISSSQGTDNVLLPTSTLPPATSAESQPSSTTAISRSNSSDVLASTGSSNISNPISPAITTSSPDYTPANNTTTMISEFNVTSFNDADGSSHVTTGTANTGFSADTSVVISTARTVIHTTEEPIFEEEPKNNNSTNSSEISESTTQIMSKPTSDKPLTTGILPSKSETSETTPAHGPNILTTKPFLAVTTEKTHVLVDAEDDHDDTLKYNVTITDLSDKKINATEQDADYNEGDKDEEENEKGSEVPSTTTLVIIEEITTKLPSGLPTTGLPIITTTTREQQPSTTMSSEDDVHQTTEADLDESSVDRSLHLTFQASYKEMCPARDSLAESIANLLKETGTRNILPSQIRILNLGMNECSSKSKPLTEKVPVLLHVTDGSGRSDQNLTDLLYSHLKRGRLNFKYQVSDVEMRGNPVNMEEDEWSGTVVAAIVISSLAGVSLFAITILLMIMRKRQKGFTSYGQRCTPVSLEDYSLDNISVFNSVRRKAMRASKRSYGNPAFDDPVTVTNPLNFVSLSNMANSHAKIDTEFSEVPSVTVKPDELPPGAESKNRYANVIPIPETRVTLPGTDQEDTFINANYVKGAKGAEKFYIACQAPLNSTIADFWMMVWDQQTQVILMLTDLHENGVEKCADYLPPSEVLDCHRVFGDLQVTLKKREVREKYIISSLQLRNLESNLWREVVHLWYTSWPIRGVPDDLTSIIAYLIEARSYSKPGHPVVVHCSPGTGRTGTVIAIDIAIRDFETDRIVDIPKTVYSIRRDRAGAVQTNLQYYLIYQVIHLYATKLAGGGLDSI